MNRGGGGFGGRGGGRGGRGGGSWRGRGGQRKRGDASPGRGGGFDAGGRGRGDGTPSSTSSFGRGSRGGRGGGRGRAKGDGRRGGFLRSVAPGRSHSGDSRASHGGMHTPGGGRGRGRGAHAAAAAEGPRQILFVKDPPPHALSAPVLRKHFEQYGPVSRVVVTPERRYALVKFATPADAATAKRLGKTIAGGPATLIWSKRGLPDGADAVVGGAAANPSGRGPGAPSGGSGAGGASEGDTGEMDDLDDEDEDEDDFEGEAADEDEEEEADEEDDGDEDEENGEEDGTDDEEEDGEDDGDDDDDDGAGGSHLLPGMSATDAAAYRAAIGGQQGFSGGQDSPSAAPQRPRPSQDRLAALRARIGPKRASSAASDPAAAASPSPQTRSWAAAADDWEDDEGDESADEDDEEDDSGDEDADDSDSDAADDDGQTQPSPGMLLPGMSAADAAAFAKAVGGQQGFSGGPGGAAAAKPAQTVVKPRPQKRGHSAPAANAAPVPSGLAMNDPRMKALRQARFASGGAKAAESDSGATGGSRRGRRGEAPKSISVNPSQPGIPSLLSATDTALMGGGIRGTHDISAARDFNGACEDMCPQEEWGSDNNRFEKLDPSRPHLTQRDLCIKRIKRSAAGVEVQVPKLVRTPAALVRTLDYLVANIIDADARPDARFIDPSTGSPRAPTTSEVRAYWWDRARGISNDWMAQNFQGGGRISPAVIESYERMVRAHIIFNYELSNETEFVDAFRSTNEEQLNNCLKTVCELYDHARNTGVPDLQSPHEGEFRAYQILMQMLDRSARVEMLGSLRRLPREVLDTADMKFVLDVYAAINCTNNYVRYWTLVNRGTYLQRCLMHRHFPQVRVNALVVMNRSLNPRTTEGLKPVRLAELADYLGLASAKEAGEICDHYGLGMQNFGTGVCFIPGKARFTMPDAGHYRNDLAPHLLSRGARTRRQLVDLGLWSAERDQTPVELGRVDMQRRTMSVPSGPPIRKPVPKVVAPVKVKEVVSTPAKAPPEKEAEDKPEHKDADAQRREYEARLAAMRKRILAADSGEAAASPAPRKAKPDAATAQNSAAAKAASEKELALKREVEETRIRELRERKEEVARKQRQEAEAKARAEAAAEAAKEEQAAKQRREAEERARREAERKRQEAIEAEKRRRLEEQRRLEEEARKEREREAQLEARAVQFDERRRRKFAQALLKRWVARARRRAKLHAEMIDELMSAPEPRFAASGRAAAAFPSPLTTARRRTLVQLADGDRQLSAWAVRASRAKHASWGPLDIPFLLRKSLAPIAREHDGPLAWKLLLSVPAHVANSSDPDASVTHSLFACVAAKMTVGPSSRALDSGATVLSSYSFLARRRRYRFSCVKVAGEKTDEASVSGTCAVLVLLVVARDPASLALTADWDEARARLRMLEETPGLRGRPFVVGAMLDARSIFCTPGSAAGLSDGELSAIAGNLGLPSDGLVVPLQEVAAAEAPSSAAVDSAMSDTEDADSIAEYTDSDSDAGSTTSDMADDEEQFSLAFLSRRKSRSGGVGFMYLNDERVSAALVALARASRLPPALFRCPLAYLVESRVLPMIDSAVPSGPQALITRYNAGLDWLAERVAGGEIAQLSWPPIEMTEGDADDLPPPDWNTAEQLDAAKAWLAAARLPNYTDVVPVTSDCLNELVRLVDVHSAAPVRRGAVLLAGGSHTPLSAHLIAESVGRSIAYLHVLHGSISAGGSIARDAATAEITIELTESSSVAEVADAQQRPKRVREEERGSQAAGRVIAQAPRLRVVAVVPLAAVSIATAFGRIIREWLWSYSSWEPCWPWRRLLAVVMRDRLLGLHSNGHAAPSGEATGVAALSVYTPRFAAADDAAIAAFVRPEDVGLGEARDVIVNLEVSPARSAAAPAAGAASHDADMGDNASVPPAGGHAGGQFAAAAGSAQWATKRAHLATPAPEQRFVVRPDAGHSARGLGLWEARSPALEAAATAPSHVSPPPPHSESQLSELPVDVAMSLMAEHRAHDSFLALLESEVKAGAAMPLASPMSPPLSPLFASSRSPASPRRSRGRRSSSLVPRSPSLSHRSGSFASGGAGGSTGSASRPRSSAPSTTTTAAHASAPSAGAKSMSDAELFHRLRAVLGESKRESESLDRYLRENV